MEYSRKPQIAIITTNSLEAIGLRSIITRMMPGADVFIYKSPDELVAQDMGQFFHYFISTETLVADATYFIERYRKTILLMHGEEKGRFPQNMHRLDIYLSEEELVKNILKLAERAHDKNRPEVVEDAKPPISISPLTCRETEVLRLVVSGLINKEIADKLKVSLTTVISHRKNITEKLNIKSVSGLTIFAVSHGIIKAEDI